MISSHVPNRLLCEQLKALGYPQETEFYWVNYQAWGKGYEVSPSEEVKYISGETKQTAFIDFDTTSAAPLVSEMAPLIVAEGFIVPYYDFVKKRWAYYSKQFPPHPDLSMPDAYATQVIEILRAKEKV